MIAVLAQMACALWSGLTFCPDGPPKQNYLLLVRASPIAMFLIRIFLETDRLVVGNA